MDTPDLRPSRHALPMVLLLGLLACGEQPEPDPPVEAAAPVPERAAMVADTTPEAVQAYLESEGYTTTWAFWPDRESYYMGQEPHGALLNTWLNPAALRGLELMHADTAVDNLPFGSVVVKQNHAPDSTLAAVTVMMKVEGYDPEHHDWWWMKRLPDGTVEASGRVQTCIECHGAARDHDYLMTEMADRESGM